MVSFTPAVGFERSEKIGRGRSRRPKGDDYTTFRNRIAALIEKAFMEDRLAGISNEAFEAVMTLVTPHDFVNASGSPAPTTTAPGTESRVQEMRKRVATGQRTFSKLDPDPLRNDRLALTGKPRRNGNDCGPEIHGWARGRGPKQTSPVNVIKENE